MQLTNIIYDLFELRLREAIGIVWGINDFIETASSAQLHDDHLVVILELEEGIKNGRRVEKKS